MYCNLDFSQRSICFLSNFKPHNTVCSEKLFCTEVYFPVIAAITDADHYGRLGITKLASTDEVN
jgi:hypothetical protein